MIGGNETQAAACERAFCTADPMTCNICLEHDHTHMDQRLDLPEFVAEDYYNAPHAP
jgi:hypothetical protein